MSFGKTFKFTALALAVLMAELAAYLARFTESLDAALRGFQIDCRDIRQMNLLEKTLMF